MLETLTGETEKAKYEMTVVEITINLKHVGRFFEETFQLLSIPALLLTKHGYYKDQKFSCHYATKGLEL